MPSWMTAAMMTTASRKSKMLVDRGGRVAGGTVNTVSETSASASVVVVGAVVVGVGHAHINSLSHASVYTVDPHAAQPQMSSCHSAPQ